MPDHSKFSLVIAIDSVTDSGACDFLAGKSGLSKLKIKDAMNKGAVWIKKKTGAFRRLRTAKTPLRKGDTLAIYYDSALLSITPPSGKCLSDRKKYTIWYKPAGLLSEGTKYGDHCSIMRQAAKHFSPPREVYLVHRLDREVDGLLILAHDRDAAARFSRLFRENLIGKKYRVEVAGDLGGAGRKGRIEIPLDGKPALTRYEVISYDSGSNVTLLEAVIDTGRLHQIRRHLDMIGHPVMGDPKYGKGNKNTEGIKLSAFYLKFRCPFEGKDLEFTL